MPVAINIDNSHVVTVTNILNYAGNPVSAITAATCDVLDADGTVVDSQNMTGDVSTQACQIGPIGLVENAQYKLRIQIIADGATMTGQCNFIARYRDICDGIF